MLKKRDVQKLFVEDTVRKKLSKIIHERNGTGWSQHGNEEIKFWAGGLDEKNPSSSVWIHILQPTKDPRTKSEEINTFSLSSWDWTVIFSYSWVFSHKMGLVSFAVLALRLCNLDQIILPAFPILQLTKGTGRDFWASITTWQSLCVNKQMNKKKVFSILSILFSGEPRLMHSISYLSVQIILFRQHFILFAPYPIVNYHEKMMFFGVVKNLSPNEKTRKKERKTIRVCDLDTYYINKW